MQDGHVVPILRIGDDIAETVKILVERFELFEPIPVRAEYRRMIHLALIRNGIGIEMVAHSVYAVEILIIADALQFPRRNVVTGTAERLAEHKLLPELRDRAPHLAGRDFIAAVAAEPVDAGIFWIFT